MAAGSEPLPGFQLPAAICPLLFTHAPAPLSTRVYTRMYR
jgi:hypothetical protein